MKRSRFLAIASATTLSLALLAGCGQANSGKQTGHVNYPTRSITYTIPFAAGGESDIAARLQQPLLEKDLGQSIVITYKPGGGGAVGWAELVHQKPDGYNIAGFNVPHIILQPLLRKNAGYQTEQINPVVIFQSTPIGLCVAKNSPINDLKDFVAYAKSHPGKITVGGSGTDTGHEEALLEFENLTGTKLDYVPFSGAAPQMQAFLGGHVQAVFANSDGLVQYQDKMKILAIGAESRLTALPNVPTFKELGYNLTGSIDRGVAVPPGTDPQIVKSLEDAFMKIASDPTLRAQMVKQGYVPVAMNAAQSEAYIQKEMKEYQTLVQQNNLGKQ